MDEMQVTDGVEADVESASTKHVSREELVEAIVEAIRRGELRLEVGGETVRAVP